MNDPTENIRRALVEEINSTPNGRAQLEAEYGQVWDTAEATNDFEFLGFMAPFVVVRRRSDNARGSLTFQHYPRFYFSFSADR